VAKKKPVSNVVREPVSKVVHEWFSHLGKLGAAARKRKKGKRGKK
jgi:hypothetical protein